MRDLKVARTSLSVGGGAPKPFVVWAARLVFFPPPPFVARRDVTWRDAAAGDDDAKDDDSLASEKPDAGLAETMMHIMHARSMISRHRVSYDISVAARIACWCVFFLETSP